MIDKIILKSRGRWGGGSAARKEGRIQIGPEGRIKTINQFPFPNKKAIINKNEEASSILNVNDPSKLK